MLMNSSLCKIEVIVYVAFSIYKPNVFRDTMFSVSLIEVIEILETAVLCVTYFLIREKISQKLLVC